MNTVSKLDTSCGNGVRDRTAQTRYTGAYHWAQHAGLERRLDLLLNELLEVNMVGKEGMRSDLFCPVDSQALRRVSGEETSEDASRLCANIIAKDERVV